MNIIKQIGQVSGFEDASLIGGAALLVAEFLSAPESEGVYFPGPELNFAANTNQATGRNGAEVDAAYQERYAEEPTSSYMHHADDAATLLLWAIENTAVAEGDSLLIDMAKLWEALTSVKDFSGINGTISCDEFGDCGTGRVHISYHTDSSVTDPEELPVVYRFAP